MSHAISLLPVIPIRKSAAHRSEMVSQLFFGELVTIIGEEESFLNVITEFDQYEGWIQKGQVFPISREYWQPTGRFSDGYTTEILVGSTRMMIPFGTELVNIRPEANIPGASEGLNTQTVSECFDSKPFIPELLKDVYQVYLNTPYLWGGRSVFGIDCSGFCQQVFRLFNIKLQRDAYQQARQGREVVGFAEARPGDLAFFNNDEGKIVHVGIMLEHNTIVHASAWVRIDGFTEEGIFHDGKRTHQLHSIRRLVE